MATTNLNQSRSIIIIASLMVLFGLAEIVTGVTHCL